MLQIVMCYVPNVEIALIDNQFKDFFFFFSLSPHIIFHPVSDITFGGGIQIAQISVKYQ